MTVSAPSRTRRLVWRAVRTLTTPLFPDDYLDLVDPLRNPRYLRARVAEIRAETVDAATVTLHPGLGWAGHVPGQFVRVGVDVDGVRLWRAYSVTSGPRDDGRITITVKSLSGGLVSSHLHDSLRVGQLVHLEQASGEFVWKGGAEPTLYVTGGSGITPVMGMLRHRLAVEGGGPGAHDIVVLHSAGHPEDVIFADELRDLADRGQVRLIERYTQTDGRIEPADLDQLVPDWRDREVYACGPVGMLRMLREFAALNGVEDKLHTENFVVELAEPGEGGTATIVLGEHTQAVDVGGDSSILDAAEAADILMPSGCRMGICYGCVLPLRSGSVRDLRTGDVTSGTGGDGVMIQTCITSAAGDCTIGR